MVSCVTFWTHGINKIFQVTVSGQSLQAWSPGMYSNAASRFGYLFIGLKSAAEAIIYIEYFGMEIQLNVLILIRYMKQQ